MNLGDIRTEIRDRLAESNANADFYTNTFINRQINEAIRRFSNEDAWVWLSTKSAPANLVIGTATYTLQNDVAFNRQFNVVLTQTGTTSTYQPRRVTQAEGLYLRRIHTSNSTPLFYYLETAQLSSGNMQQTIRFVPAPDKTYDFEYIYYRRPATLVNDADEADVPEDYCDAIVAWATGMCWLRETNTLGKSKADEQFTLYAAVVSQAKETFKGLAPDEQLIVGAEEPDYRMESSPFYLRIPDQITP